MGMRSELQHRNLSEIREQLNEWYPTEKFDILLKCWNVDVFTEMCMQHCGEHTMITRACINNDCFRVLLDECQEQASSLWASGQNTIRVMCVSDQGRHRSVAVSSTLRSVYLKLGFKSLGPTHLSKVTWWGLCHTCNDCKPNDYKNEMITALARGSMPHVERRGYNPPLAFTKAFYDRRPAL